MDWLKGGGDFLSNPKGLQLQLHDVRLGLGTENLLILA